MNALLFWPRFVGETLYKHALLVGTIVSLLLTARRIGRAANAAQYTDKALTAVGDEEENEFDLVTQTSGGVAAVAHSKKVASLTSAARN